MSVRLGSWVVLGVPLALALAGCGDTGSSLSPRVVNQSIITNEDVPVTIDVLKDGDPMGGPVTIVASSVLGHRVEVIADAMIEVTPGQNFHGTFRVSYSVGNGTRSASAYTDVTVLPVNDAPVATGGALNVARTANLVLAGTDIDDDTLTYEIVSPPVHGSFQGEPPALRYTAEAGFQGEDSFSFRVHDGTAASEPATIRLEIRNTSAPVAPDGRLLVNEDQFQELALNATDRDGDLLTYSIETHPLHGTLTGEPPNLTYTPAADFHGTDSFQFKAHDGFVSSELATIAITVAPINDAPVAIAQAVAATEDTALTITLTGNDIDGDAISFELDTPPSNGSVTGNGATLTYAPDRNFHGTDRLLFKTFDGRLRSQPVAVDIQVAAVDDPPVALPTSAATSEDVQVDLVLPGVDGDGEPLTYAVAQPRHGLVTGTPPELTYTPNANFNGVDTFTYTVSSNDDTSVPATVTVQVSAVNDPPVAQDSTVTTLEDTQITIPLPASDVDGQALVYSIVAQPTDGALTGSGASRTYRPAANVSGQRTFRFRASDGQVSSEATITIEISPVNDAPIAVDDFVMTGIAEPLTFAVLGNDSDVEGDSLTLDAVAAPAHGTIEMVGQELRYTPEPGFTGTEVFTYTVVDAQAAASTGTIHLGVGIFPPGAPTETIATIGGAIGTGTAARAPAISHDERFIAFTSPLALVATDNNGLEDVYLFDRKDRTLTRVSVATGGGEANGRSQRPQLSATGQYIVFESAASNLVTGDSNARTDVFRHDRVSGQTIRISVPTASAPGPSEGSGNSFDPRISDDGNLIAFTSVAFELVPGDANGAADVFVRDVSAGVTSRISATASGGDGDQDSAEPALSGDGRLVAFSSTATNLVAGDGNARRDIFVRDRLTGTTTRVSVSSTGSEANQDCASPSMSRDGRFVAFLSASTTLVPPSSGTLIFVRDLAGPTTTRPLQNGAVSARLSGDGRYLVGFDANQFALPYVTDRFTPERVTFPNSATWFWPTISSNGRYIVTLDAASGGRLIVAPNPL